MILETVDLTPDDAAKMLNISAQHEHVNRSLRKANLERLTHAILNGQWRETHQAIAVSPDGVIIDGQHRLNAIVAANQTVRVLIARDVDPSTFAVIDTGVVRSPYDVLMMAGLPNASRLGASCRYLLIYDDVVGSLDSFSTHRAKFSSADILDMASSDRGRELASSLNAASSVAMVLGRPGFATWLGVVIQLMRESPVDDGLCLEFVERLRDGANLKVGSPILTLRRYIIGDGGLIKANGGERAQMGMGSCIKAFNAWLDGADRTVFSFRTGLERMPAIVPTMPGGFLAN
jgi:hypothetical protein